MRLAVPTPRIDQLDLNLLRVFAAVHRERHITRAGLTLHMSQSAVSHALARLRDVFGDPLFIRGPQGMTPTALAERLAGPILDALRTVEEALAKGMDFTPATTRMSVTIGTSTAQPFSFLPSVFRRLELEAPSVNLYVKSLTNDEIEAELNAGTLDVGIGRAPNAGNAAPGALESEPLQVDPLTCVVCEHNPEIVGRELDLEAYARLPHLIIARNVVTRTWIDELLAARGLRRRIAAVVPHAHALPLMLPGTRLICTVARSIVVPFLGTSPLRMLRPPFEAPEHVAHLLWHVRSSADPAQRWIRAILRESSATASAAAPAADRASAVSPRRTPARKKGRKTGRSRERRASR